MNLWVFPLVGAATVFLIIVPLGSLLAWALLTALPLGKDPVIAQERSWRVALIVAPTALPLVWLLSAAVHAARMGDGCSIHHLDGESCQDGLLFAAALAGALVLSAARWLLDRAPPARPSQDPAAQAQLAQLLATTPSLTALRVRLVQGGAAPACTRGLLWPRIELDAGLMGRLPPEELQAILLHEAEHARARDGLRVFLARMALSMNPLARLLRPELARYRFAREALSDRRAVDHGADPLALAQGLVALARAPAQAAAGQLATLTGAGIGGVQLRVQLLLGYAAQRPPPLPQRWPLSGLALAAAAIAVAPHLFGAGPLDRFHHAIEHLLLGLLNG